MKPPEKPKILTKKELAAIMPRLSGWKLTGNKLRRTLEFQDFVQSLSFVNSLVAYFETVDHHPDVCIAYGEVTFELTRYDVGGRVTDRDVEVAKKISSVYRGPILTDVEATRPEHALHYALRGGKAMALTNRSSRQDVVKNEEGAIGYIFLWLLGVPTSVLFLVFLLRGCN